MSNLALKKKEDDNIFSKKTENKIICGDVISVLNSISKIKKYDLIIIDPPYNIGKNFGNNKYNMHLKDYIDWCKDWLDLSFQCLAEEGLIYVYGFTEILARLSINYDIDKQKFLIWHYTNKTIPTYDFWQRSHESILCLWKKDKPKLKINQIREPYSKSYLKCGGKIRQNTKGRFTKSNKKTTYKVHENGALPRDVIKIPALAGGLGSKERLFMCRDCGDKLFHPRYKKEHLNHNILQHPTQKPFKLTEKLILSKIEKGVKGSVLIPFSGSGSECVVAKNMGVDFLGIDINNHYVDFSNKWLESKLCID